MAADVGRNRDAGRRRRTGGRTSWARTAGTWWARCRGHRCGTGAPDLVYTGKGALIWLPHLRSWSADAARLPWPSGHLFVYEGHPAVRLWTWDADVPRLRPDRGYFARSHVNDTFPGNGAMERPATLGEIVTAVISAISS